MSLELDWSTVDYELTRSVHRFLSDAFAATRLPDFVGPISVDHFSFGDEQPDIAILDITDIDKQFLLPDHDDPDSEHGEPLPPPQPPRSRSRSRSHSPAPFNSRYTDSYTHASPAGPGYPPRHHPEPELPPPPLSSAPSPSFQLLVRISYSGNLSLALSTSLRINYPSPSFMSLPLQLSLTDLAFQGVLVVAFEGGHNRIHLSLVEAPPPEAQPTTLASMMAATSSRPPTNGTAAARAATRKERFLQSAHVESRVGNADKHVLRNVGKVEKFVLDVARTTLENELVFPCVSPRFVPPFKTGTCLTVRTNNFRVLLRFANSNFQTILF